MSSFDRGFYLGPACVGDDRYRFRVWGPNCGKMELHVVSPEDRIVPMQNGSRGYYEAVVDGIGAGSRYFFRLDGERDRPDPASRFQPDGVHGPSQVMNSDFKWSDAGWRGVPLDQYIIYELHIGTFTREGTFDSAARSLDELVDLGVTAVELMPLAQFPGSRNWGYDGVYPFAVQNSYGGPDGLKRFVDACHQSGLAVIIDVVYNHLGPEGNYLSEFGAYFTDQYKTPWGRAINFDGPHSDEVRQYFIENALYWIIEFHADALRLDAVHAILDHSAVHFFEELASGVKRLGEVLSRRIYVMVESDLNDSRLVRPQAIGGYGLDAQWTDDFHHALHTLLTGENGGYYQDFGRLQHLVKVLREGFVYTGEYAPSRGRRHGNSPRGVAGHQLIVFSQNHDQIGNRMAGERLNQLVSFEAAKLAAGSVLLSPFVPLLFMGEEYGETAPFQYFVSHSDPPLVEAVRKGRREEFAQFTWDVQPPDPQAEGTFEASKLNRDLRREGNHSMLYELYKTLIKMRKSIPAFSNLSKEEIEVIGFEKQQVVYVRRWSGADEVFCEFNFGKEPAALPIPVPSGVWKKLLHSADPQWGGGSAATPGMLTSDGEVSTELEPLSFAVFERCH